MSSKIHWLYRLPPPISFVVPYNLFILDQSRPTSEFRITKWNMDIGVSILSILNILKEKDLSIDFWVTPWEKHWGFLECLENIFFACPADIYIIIYLWCDGTASLCSTLLTHKSRQMKAKWITQHPEASDPELCHFDVNSIFEGKPTWKQLKCSSKWIWVRVKRPINRLRTAPSLAAIWSHFCRTLPSQSHTG